MIVICPIAAPDQLGFAGYSLWRANFGQPGSGSVAIASATVPEPATAGMLMCIAAGLCLWRVRAASKVPATQYAV